MSGYIDVYPSIVASDARYICIDYEAPATGPSKAVTSLSSSSGDRWSGAKTVDVIGTAFVSGDQVQVDGANVTTTFIDASTLRASVPNTVLWENGTKVFTVVGATGSANYVVAYGSTILDHHRADAGITLNGSNVQVYASLLGDATKNRTQLTTGAQPVYSSSDADWNNTPSLSGTGTRWMQSGDWTVAQPRTRIVLFKSSVGARGIADGKTNTAGQQMRAYQSTTTVLQSFAGSAFNTTIPNNVPIILVQEFNGASSGTRVNKYSRTASGNAGTGAAVGSVIMANFGGASPATMSTPEDIELSGNDDTMIREITAYLAARYNITVAA